MPARRLITSLGLVGAAVCTSAHGGFHERGNLSVSVAGSVAHTSTYDRRSETAVSVVYNEDFSFTEVPEPGESFTDLDTSVFLSLGYFVRDRFELGLSGSVLQTTYSGTDRDDFSIYDAQLYAKYFFDNASRFTPYLKAKGGLSWLDTGDYSEENAILGGVAGLEYTGFGPMSFFLELTSDYTELGGTLRGSEWRNQVYFGVSWYVDFSTRLKRRKHNREVLSGLEPATRKRLRNAEKKWGRALQRVDSASHTSL